MRLAVFRPYDDPAGRSHVGPVIGVGADARVHAFSLGTGVVELLAADPEARYAADEAAATDGPRIGDVMLLPCRRLRQEV